MSFDYSAVPEGFYDKVLDGPDGMRKFWHWHKFDSVMRCMELTEGSRLLDVGCFSGSFLGRFTDPLHVQSVGVDILPEQIKYASEKFGTAGRNFLAIKDFEHGADMLRGEVFDAVTFIEVIEHLTAEQIRSFFSLLSSVTRRGSEVVITTPNYCSAWPVLELILNSLSEVTYEEQHITKFTYFNIKRRLSKIVPDLFENYEISLLTTSHFITPYLAMLNYQTAVNFSTSIEAVKWHNPFGSLIIVKLKKKT